MDTRGVGSFIKQLRKNKNLTQQQLADALFISPQAVSKWERGESLPDVTSFSDIAEVLDVPVWELFGEFSNRPSTFENLVDESVYNNFISILTNTTTSAQLDIPFEILGLFNQKQKEQIINAILKITDCHMILEDVFLHSGNVQREIIVNHLIQQANFAELEVLVPLMNQGLKQTVLKNALDAQNYDFVEGLMPFLTRDLKWLIITEYQLPIDILENLIPFFEPKQLLEIYKKENAL